MNISKLPNFSKLFNRKPQAVAFIKGSNEYKQLQGKMWLYQTGYGVIVVVDIMGLPYSNECASPIFALHIHEGNSCTGNEQDPFANAMQHYNPKNCQHPYHAGDLPPLFSVNGGAFMAVITNRFTVSEVIGKVVIIHSSVDDFTSQPSGNSGRKIACGKILKID